MKRSLHETIQYLISYYRAMDWDLRPEDILTLCLDECAHEYANLGGGIAGVIVLRHAIAHLRIRPRMLFASVHAANEHEAYKVLLAIYGDSALFIEAVPGPVRLGGPWRFKITFEAHEENEQ